MDGYSKTREGKIPVVAVIGPTASGKTALAVRLALRYGGEVVSADSMQVYRGMEIATAKPTPGEMAGVPHHLIGFCSTERAYSVADYLADAHAAIADIQARGKLPILAGGTGLYVDSLLHDLRHSQTGGDPDYRRELAQLAEREGARALWERLLDADPETAATLHENDRGRIIRALEIWRETGTPMSEHKRRSRGESRYRSLRVGLDYQDRRILYDRIDLRVDQMLEAGLLREAEQRLAAAEHATAAQAIGHKELAGYFAGKLPLTEAVEGLKRETRRYAKRQLTWFRRDPTVNWFYPDSYKSGELEKKIEDCIENFLRICYDE